MNVSGRTSGSRGYVYTHEVDTRASLPSDGEIDSQGALDEMAPTSGGEELDAGARAQSSKRRRDR